MPVPFPDDHDVNLLPPDAAEASLSAAGVLSAVRTADGNTEFQKLLIAATFEAMTGHAIDAGALPYVDAETNARNLRLRAPMFRMRMVHMMVLAALVLRPVPPAVAENVAAYSRELGIDDGLLRTVQQFAASHEAIAAVDFERNGYTADWAPERAAALHTSVSSAGDVVEHDPVLAARWDALADLPDGPLGRLLHGFYLARGFSVPGAPDSAPPLLAQHDWVHVLAEYGTHRRGRARGLRVARCRTVPTASPMSTSCRSTGSASLRCPRRGAAALRPHAEVESCTRGGYHLAVGAGRHLADPAGERATAGRRAR